jgi:hypothetical protein
MFFTRSHMAKSTLYEQCVWSFFYGQAFCDNVGIFKATLLSLGGMCDQLPSSLVLGIFFFSLIFYPNLTKF